MTQKLKTYNTEAEVPTELKGFYAERNGKWEPQVEGFDSVSAFLTKHSELLGKVSGHATELSTRDAEISRLKSDLQNANTVPRGHEAVSKADADLVRAVKEAGITKPEEFATLKTEYGNYKTKAETADKLAHAESVGEAMGWDKGKTALLVSDVFDLSQVEVRDGADGKKQAVAKVKQADNTFVEKTFADVVKITPKLSALLPVLTAGSNGGGDFITQGNGGAATKDIFDANREDVKHKEQSRGQQSGDLHAFFKPKEKAA